MEKYDQRELGIDKFINLMKKLTQYQLWHSDSYYRTHHINK